MSGSNSHTSRLAGTAASGCGMLVTTASRDAFHNAMPLSRMGNATASPSGMLWIPMARAM